MIPRESDPDQVRADNEFPLYACCGNCSRKTIQLDGTYWCNEHKDEVDEDHICDSWAD